MGAPTNIYTRPDFVTETVRPPKPKTLKRRTRQNLITMVEAQRGQGVAQAASLRPPLGSAVAEGLGNTSGTFGSPVQTLAEQIAAYNAMQAAASAPKGPGPRGLQGGPVDGKVGDTITPGFNGYSQGVPKWAVGTQLITNRGVTLQEDAMRALQQASKMAGRWIGGGGFRTMSSQVSLAASKPGLAAAPGHSYHQLGLAIDVNNPTPQVVRALKAVGFRQFDAAKEPWHFSYRVVG